MAIFQDFTLGQYYPGHSFLHNLDPRTKLLASILLMTSLLLASNYTFVLGIVAVCALGICMSQIPGHFFLKNLRPFVWLFIITFLIHALTTPGTALITAPFVAVSVTEQGLWSAGVYTIRLGLLIITAALLTLTTAPIDLTDGLERLLSPLKRIRVPVHEFVLMVTLSLRFLPILLQEAQRLRNAQVSRGASFEGNLMNRIKNIVPMIVPLFISALRRADELAIAMEARNYAGGSGRTVYRKLKMTLKDYSVLTGAVMLLMLSAG